MPFRVDQFAVVTARSSLVPWSFSTSRVFDLTNFASHVCPSGELVICVISMSSSNFHTNFLNFKHSSPYKLLYYRERFHRETGFSVSQFTPRCCSVSGFVCGSISGFRIFWFPYARENPCTSRRLRFRKSSGVFQMFSVCTFVRKAGVFKFLWCLKCIFSKSSVFVTDLSGC